MDVAQYLGEHRYVALLDLIDQLPAASRFNEAVVNDEEFAEYLLDLEEQGGAVPGESWAPRGAEFDLTNQLLSTVVDELKALRISGQALAGGKPKREDPMPRPRTAVERVRARRDEQAAINLAVMFGFDRNDFK